MKFHQDKTYDRKVMAFNNFCTKAVLSALPGPAPKRCELPLSLLHLDKLFMVGKLLISEAELCRFSRIGQKISKLQLYRVFA